MQQIGIDIRSPLRHGLTLLWLHQILRSSSPVAGCSIANDDPCAGDHAHEARSMALTDQMPDWHSRGISCCVNEL
jgi:hypothetical protein